MTARPLVLSAAVALGGCTEICNPSDSEPEPTPKSSTGPIGEETEPASKKAPTAATLSEATPEKPLRPEAQEVETHSNPAGAPPEGSMDLDQLKLPEGFSVELYTDEVPAARTLVQGAPGVVYVGTRKKDVVYAVVDRDEDHKVDDVHVVAEGLQSPNGLAYRDGTLFIAEIGRVIALVDVDERLQMPPEPRIVSEELPEERHHGWRFTAFGPNGKLYIGIGAPCDNCKRPEPLFASISRMDIAEDLKPSRLEVFAHGVRNSVGFAWHPETNNLWFTDNGRDMLGDDLPPDELNRAPKKGLHFGYPACHAGVIADPEFSRLRSCAESTPPVQQLGPHVAALGLEFTIGKGWPEPHTRSVLICEHGSWNRETKTGYRVSEVRLDEKNQPTSYEPFVRGFVESSDDRVLGRPVDLEFLEDGSLLVSDDYRGAIYRVVPPN